MADKVVTVAAKPQLRGLLNKQIGVNLAVAIGLAITSGVAFKYMVAEPRKQRYAEYYRTYDAEKDFEIMKSKGLFQSC